MPRAKTGDDAVASRAPKQRGAGHRSLFVNSIQKGFAVLNAFSRERPRLTLAAITAATKLEKSAAQRFVYTLHELGLLRKDETTKQYSLSPRLLEFAYAYIYSDGLIERAQPFLVEVHEKTGETVNLFVLDGTDIILVSRIPGRNVVSLNIQVGLRMPALYSATGRVIASRLPPDERDVLLRQTRYHAHTPRSVTDRAEMRALIEKAGKDGYAITCSQWFTGDVSVSAPIIDGSGRVVGAVSASAPERDMTVAGARKTLMPATVEAARKISVAMGAY
jgi:IclR family transcriptional regulator, pca regulon regulatory protein